MFQAILNVLGILVLAIVAGFILLLLIDLVLGCIDGKRGVIFFKNRKNTGKDNEILLQYNKDANLNDSYYLQNNSQDLVLDFDKEFEKENEPKENNNIDMQKAEEEQKMLEAKNAEAEEVVEEDNKEILEPETEVNEEFTFINKVSPELEKELEEEQNKEENLKIDDEDDDFSEFDEEDEDDDEEDKSIEEILNAIRERNKMARNKFLAEEEIDSDFEDEDEDLEETVQEVEEEKAEAEEIVESTEEQNQELINSEINKLNEIIKELNAKIEAEQAKNAEIEEKAKQDIENIKKEYEEKANAEVDEMPLESLETLEEKLADLIEREKQNDKDLKANKKEYIPLARIERTLENDQNKLRRREAIVAKKKIVLFGVNNYVVDEEKEKKLKEDLDLLEGLRMSVNHCEEVMEANKDRYPVLKRTNEILTRNAEQIENDIKEVEAKIAKIKEAQGNNDTTGDNASEN